MIGQSAEGSVPDVAASRKGHTTAPSKSSAENDSGGGRGGCVASPSTLPGPCLRSRDRIPHAPRYRERGGTVSGDSRRL